MVLYETETTNNNETEKRNRGLKMSFPRLKVLFAINTKLNQSMIDRRKVEEHFTIFSIFLSILSIGELDLWNFLHFERFE